ncbi:MAG TPA: hypothetical protein VE131_00490 [Terriglobales bacterium]|nr:hypothetical protein [Terriglobales bacterium]
MGAATAERVRINTPPYVNEQIRRQTEANLAYYANRPHEIDNRLAELDREWDIERLIEVDAASLFVLGVLRAVVRRKGVFLPIIAGSMLLVHSIQGWYPLLPLLRRLGVRTPEEIGYERNWLKALRGDFRLAEESGDGKSQSERAFLAAWPKTRP